MLSNRFAIKGRTETRINKTDYGSIIKSRCKNNN